MNAKRKAYAHAYYQRNKEKMSLYSKNWYEEHKTLRPRILVGLDKEDLDELKTGPCSDCGNTFPPECMDWDHIKGKKLYNVSQMKEYGKDLIMEEISKCELVCANCHRI